jgi:putative transposase
LANAFEGFAAGRLNWTIDPGQVTVVTDVMIGGPELECDAMADWARERVGLHFIPPGESWRNSYVESFNSRIRDECLNINIFWSLAQARVVITDWKQDYSHRRRHSSLGYQAPAVYAAACGHW